MKITARCIIIFFIVLTGCTSSSFEKNNIPDSIGGDSNTLLLNYENRAKEYDQSNIDSHMRIYIEIEKPYIINPLQLKELKKIYSLSGIEGIAVFRMEIDNNGTIVSSKQVLSAGLGLDELAQDIIKQIKVDAAYLAGKPGISIADIKIIFQAVDDE